MRMQRAILILSVALASIVQASAGDFPSRPITLVVPFSVGGPTDSLARALSDRMSASLNQPVIIENVSGAGGTIGVGRVVHAKPDGYTLSIGNWTSHVINGAVYTLPYDLRQDLVPIALLPANPQLIVSRNTIPAKDLGELIAWIKLHQATLSVGTGGAGTAAHVSGAYFENITGTHFQFVPYRGTGPAMQDLVAGHIDVMFDQSAEALPLVRAGLAKAYAVTASARLASAPDIPTVDEAGLPGFYVSIWHGLWAPKGTPKEVISKLNRAMVAAMADADLKKRFADLGLELPASAQQTPEAFASFQKAEIEKWWPLIKAANIRSE